MKHPSLHSRTNISRKRTTAIAAILFILFVGVVLYVYLQQRQNGYDNTVIVSEKATRGMDAKNSIEKMTTRLSNGKTAIYENTASNRKIILGESAKGMNYIALSHSDVEDFLKSSDQEIITRLCGASGERAQRENVIIATMSASERMIEFGVDDSCMNELTTMRNTDQGLRKEAITLIDIAENDIKEFYKAVIIK